MRPTVACLILLVLLALAVATAQAPPPEMATKSLVAPGLEPVLTIFYTGEVKGYLEACG